MNEQKFNIYSPDVYLSLGVSTVLNIAFATIQEISTQKFHFILLSGMTLMNASKFCYSLHRGKKYIVISDPRILPLLQIPNGIKVESFIDVGLPTTKLFEELCSAIRRGNKMDSVTPPLIYPLSMRERVIVDYIHRGMSPTLIARLTKLSIKTISTHKRNIMKKLRVTSDQQLYMKLLLLRNFRVI